MNSDNSESVESPTTDVTKRDVTSLLDAYEHMQRQNHRMTNHLANELSLGHTDLRVLLYVHRLHDLSPKDIAVELDHTTGSVTALVDRLAKSGHLTRRAHPTDRRSQTLHLTELGEAAVQRVHDTYSTAFVGMFPDETLHHASGTLETLGDALMSQLPPGGR